MTVEAPRKIYEELFEKRKNIYCEIQKLCGRKVVSWSDRISVNDIAKIYEKNHITPNEVFFAASSSAVYSFLEEFKGVVPKDLDSCARYVERDHVLGKTNYSDGTFCLLKRKLIVNCACLLFILVDVTGYVLVNLPMEPHSKRQVEKIRKNFDKVQPNQFPFFLLYEAQRRYEILTKILPQWWIQLLFNYLSKRYTISLTRLAESNEPEIGTMLWEHKILDVIYFTPPQSNISKD